MRQADAAALRAARTRSPSISASDYLANVAPPSVAILSVEYLFAVPLVDLAPWRMKPDFLRNFRYRRHLHAMANRKKGERINLTL
jgi:hypothetical protein